MDYRNAIKWYQYDPTKWFITTMSWLGLASHLKSFPDNEVRKGQLTMELKKIKEKHDSLKWPTTSNDLPIITWDSCEYILPFYYLILINSQSKSKPRLVPLFSLPALFTMSPRLWMNILEDVICCARTLARTLPLPSSEECMTILMPPTT